ncbi:ABC transporter substrate-binding protein [Roseomonas sp. OT10]|uniref:ABC transporter substrate-binding protein n=1 Tax=Roseomonas cutis TaxID=2897332 RepID=UPI001E283A73|nr:ABC transporter substrate-binding protein [Roseomonas sp. OT10]UFN48507.1 ABC transporter substrate-binding protein [Roseomonas sp. OT10]
MIGRRTLLAAGAATTLAGPRLARAQPGRILRFVPQADLPNLDPVAGTQLVVANGSRLVYDTLYGIGADFVARPQMCAGHELSDDSRIWTFVLRPDLRFHDGEPVLAKDAVASIARWMRRDSMGQILQARLDTVEVLDDRRFRLRLKQPFPQLLYAFAKPRSNMLAIMPARIAELDAFKVVPEYIGSGPMRFRRDEWVAGSRAVFERFDAYSPRPEPADWLAGGKRVLVDRVEWITMPDAATAANALVSGEIDWWESPVSDLMPLLEGRRGIRTGIADPLGNLGILRLNHLHPPFNDVRARRALQMAVDQEDYMRAVAGDDPAMWKRLPSFFTPGTPYYTEEGGEVLRGPRRLDEARRLLAEAGYGGERVVLLVATDVAITKAQGEVTADLMRRLGLNVDFQSLDWGTVGSRRANKGPPEQGGWHAFHTWNPGSGCVTPAGYSQLDATGDKAWFGWPRDEAVQARIADWYAATDEAGAKQAMGALNRASMRAVTSIPTGFFMTKMAWRQEVQGVISAPFPCFWGIGKG